MLMIQSEKSIYFWASGDKEPPKGKNLHFLPLRDSSQNLPLPLGSSGLFNTHLTNYMVDRVTSGFISFSL